MDDFDDIIPEYVAESTELLETIERGLLELEQGSAGGEFVHTIFRAIHSIKGGAGFVGLGTIERLAHRMEDILNLVRNGDLEPGQMVIDALLQALDVLVSLFERIEEQADVDIEPTLKALDAALGASDVGEDVKESLDTRNSPSADSGLPQFEVSEYVLKDKLNKSNLFHLKLDLAALEEKGMGPLALVNELLALGEILDSVVSMSDEGDVDQLEAGRVILDVLFSTVLGSDLLSGAINVEEDTLHELGPDDFADPQAEQVVEQPVEAVEEAPAPASAPTPEPAPAPAPAQPPAAQPPAAFSAPGPPSKPPQSELPELIAAVEEEPEEQLTEHLTFTLGGELYGVNIMMVQEIIGIPHLTRLPRTAEHVLGVMNLRGMVVPVFDLRHKLSLPVKEDDDPVVVVVRVGEKTMGAVVDGVNDVLELNPDDIQHSSATSNQLNGDYLLGLTSNGDDMVILMDLDKLLEAEVEAGASQ